MPETISQGQTISPVPPNTAPAAPKKLRAEVLIYATWCKGCRICVELCPTQVLAMEADEERPRVVLPEKCTACHFCDTHCPDMAIVVRKVD
jgi:2-oxoglutarate ferredoxin oxidoreductase subunit delta